ncbi:UNKNOWN [Stylonychia lemnae]|uniref:Uncharacterized protein n=1 Tax=Stylonychia lemnae TaxID=5949 RepID=A0A078AYU1_STYLE|nr:UNKNOWN [Stylonychia lemnae]|eukprot:CDW87605.1 UNKNOWN [Stylonychia lemnae]
MKINSQFSPSKTGLQRRQTFGTPNSISALATSKANPRSSVQLQLIPDFEPQQHQQPFHKANSSLSEPNFIITSNTAMTTPAFNKQSYSIVSSSQNHNPNKNHQINSNNSKQDSKNQGGGVNGASTIKTQSQYDFDELKLIYSNSVISPKDSNGKGPSSNKYAAKKVSIEELTAKYNNQSIDQVAQKYHVQPGVNSTYGSSLYSKAATTVNSHKETPKKSSQKTQNQVNNRKSTNLESNKIAQMNSQMFTPDVFKRKVSHQSNPPKDLTSSYSTNQSIKKNKVNFDLEQINQNGTGFSSTNDKKAINKTSTPSNKTNDTFQTIITTSNKSQTEHRLSNQLFKDIQQQYQFRQQRKLEEIHSMIEEKSKQIHKDEFQARDQEAKQSLENMKEFRKCCKTCKDQDNDKNHHIHSHSHQFQQQNLNNSNVLSQANLLNNSQINDNTASKVFEKYLQSSNEEIQNIIRKKSEACLSSSTVPTSNINLASKSRQANCKCSEDVANLKLLLVQEQKTREFCQRQLKDIQDEFLNTNSSNQLEEYMLQLKDMQSKLNDKNMKIQQLSGKLKRLTGLYDNFKYIASLNQEYFALELGEGEKAYSEQQKIDFEKFYMDISKYNLQTRDMGVQCNFMMSANPNSTLQDQDPYFLRTFKETLDLEREFQTLQNENQLLKQKLYAKTLDLKPVDHKIQELRKSLTLDLDNQVKRQQAIIVEKFADFTFQLSNIGVSDIYSQLRGLLSCLFQYHRVLDQLEEKEARSWIWRVYQQLVEASGIKNALKSSHNAISRTQRSINEGNLSKSVQEFATLFNNNNSSTISTIQKSFGKDQKLEKQNTNQTDQQIGAEEHKLKVSGNEDMLLQMLNIQAHHVEQLMLNTTFGGGLDLLSSSFL